jgi:hypothetical protein
VEWAGKEVIMNGRQWILGLVLLDFSAFSAYALWEYGLVGLYQAVFANAVTTLLFTDLVIALGLVTLWMWQDARDRGVSPVPYVALTLGFGSVGPLLYLFRREAAERRPARTAALGGVRP